MSKRSYRRLAVVAGAALAVGSMAPAMAQRVEANGSGDVSIETLDANDVLSEIQATNLTSLVPITSVLATAGQAQTVATAAVGVIRTDANAILGDAFCLADAGLGATLGVSAGALGQVNVGLGGLNVGLAGVVNAPLAVAGDATECIGGIVNHALTTAGHVQAVAGVATGLATSAALGAVGTVQSLPGTVLNTAGGLLMSDALGSILSITASGQADANVVAGLLTFL